MGWSKSTVGDISRLNPAERFYVISIATSEFKPIDITGTFASTRVPRVNYTIDHNMAAALRRVQDAYSPRFSIWCRVTRDFEGYDAS